MTNHYMKIQEIYIPKIIEKIKKHEYRLCEKKWENVRVGDTIILISSKNKNYYTKVEVKKIEKYKTWKSALENYWQNDFKNIFSTLDECISSCNKYYEPNQVEKYGIIVFEVRPILIDYFDCHVLLDTNIIIKRESNNNASTQIAKLFKLFDKYNVKKYIHPLTLGELTKYKDEKSRNTLLIKSESYNLLEIKNMGNDDTFLDTINRYSKNSNDEVDNALLNEVYNENVDILITDDKAMLRKAADLYIRDKVLTSSELTYKYANRYPDNIEYKMLSTNLKYFREIDINDNFFDSFRELYNGKEFNKWFKNKSDEQAYTVYEDNNLKCFLYFKVEEKTEQYNDITPTFSPKIRMKIGTFKVAKKGVKFGERFLKLVFDNAKIKNVEELYITLFDNKYDEITALKNLLLKWGFAIHGEKNNGEIVLTKTMKSNEYNKNESPKYNYPLIINNPSYYILPIRPEYHTDLFPDLILKNENELLFQDNLSYRNAIEKIYLSGSNANPKKGDIVLIYRMGERRPKKYSSVITGVAIIQDFVKTSNVKKCLELCKDRSIFTKEEIEKIYTDYPNVVNLLDYETFRNKVILEELVKNDIIEENSGPRPFHPITKQQYTLIYKLGMEIK